MSIGMAIGVRVPDISWLVRRSKLRNGSPNGSKRITLTATSSTVGSRSVVDFQSAAGRCAQPALLPPARCTPMTKPCSQRRDSMQAPAAGPDRRMTSTLSCVPTTATAMHVPGTATGLSPTRRQRSLSQTSAACPPWSSCTPPWSCSTTSTAAARDQQADRAATENRSMVRFMVASRPGRSLPEPSGSRGGVVDASPDDLAVPVGVPAVRVAHLGDHAQPEAPLLWITADGRAGRPVGRGVADLEQPAGVGAGHGDPDRPAAVPQRVRRQLLVGQQQALDRALVGTGRAGAVVQGGGQLPPVRG